MLLRESHPAVMPLPHPVRRFPQKLGFVEKVREHMPVCWSSPNHIDPTVTLYCVPHGRAGGQASRARKSAIGHGTGLMVRFQSQGIRPNHRPTFNYGQDTLLLFNLFNCAVQWVRSSQLSSEQRCQSMFRLCQQVYP